MKKSAQNDLPFNIEYSPIEGPKLQDLLSNGSPTTSGPRTTPRSPPAPSTSSPPSSGSSAPSAKGPNPVFVANGRKNVFPESVFSGESKPWWGAAPWFWHPHHAEQWFFDDA
jgi:hypothetical protein